MILIESNVEPGRLLHCIVRAYRINDGRIDISPPNEFLQLAALRLPSGKTFRPHKHIPCAKVQTTTQESWVVIRGRVRAILYDLDDQILQEVELGPGDLSITFYGGHNYLILEDDTVVYEFKTGPYLGQEADKEFIQ